MHPDVYRVLVRLAPPIAEHCDWCRALSPNTELPDYLYRDTYPTLVCTLLKGHSGYHVAHGGGCLGIEDPNNVLDVWE